MSQNNRRNRQVCVPLGSRISAMIKRKNPIQLSSIENTEDTVLKFKEIELMTKNVFSQLYFETEASFILDSKQNITCKLEIMKNDKISYTGVAKMILHFKTELNFDYFKVYMTLKTNKSILRSFDLKKDIVSNPKNYYGYIIAVHEFFDSVIIQFTYSLANSKTNNWSNTIKNLLENKTLSDYTITSIDSVKFKVHKFVLYYTSNFFKNLLESNMLEKKNNNLNIPFDAVIVNEFINYIYNKECGFVLGVHELFRLAHMYEVNDLQSACENYMINNLKIKDITETLRLVNIYSYDLKTLKIAVDKFIKVSENLLVDYRNYIEYHLENMKAENIHVTFKLAMKSHNEEFKHKVKYYIKNNYENCFKNDLFRYLLKKNPTWAIDYLDYLSEYIRKSETIKN